MESDTKQEDASTVVDEDIDRTETLFRLADETVELLGRSSSAQTVDQYETNPVQSASLHTSLCTYIFALGDIRLHDHNRVARAKPRRDRCANFLQRIQTTRAEHYFCASAHQTRRDCCIALLIMSTHPSQNVTTVQQPDG